jgi:type II secretory pathway component PulF
MLAVPTPGRLAQHAEFYHQLAQLTDAGLTLRSALESQERHPPARWLREPSRRLLGVLNQDGTFAEAVASSRDWVPQFDAALLEAGEQSGRLPGCFRLLAEHYQERARLAREVLSNLVYPVLLFHLGILIPRLPGLILTGDVNAYVRSVAVILLPIYALVMVLLIATNSRHGEAWRGILEAFSHGIPLLGAARKNLALARLSTALHALLNAGVPVIRAWELAAAASGSVALKREVARWRPEIENGRTPGELARESDRFPELFSNMYATGEISGTVDDSLLRLYRLHQDRGVAQMRALADWLPKLIYFAIIAFVAWTILSFYIGYFGQIGKVLE